jgi:hypothetical protein
MKEEQEEANKNAETNKQKQRELAISMMTKKKKRLHDRIAYGQAKKAEHVASLEAKRKIVEQKSDQSDSHTAVDGTPKKKRRKRKNNKKKKNGGATN